MKRKRSYPDSSSSSSYPSSPDAAASSSYYTFPAADQDESPPSLPLQASPQAEKGPTINAELDLSPPLPPGKIRNSIPRHLRKPRPKDITPEESKLRFEVMERLAKTKKSEWDLEDLLHSCCMEYHRNKVTREQGLKEMLVLRNYLRQIDETEGFDVDFVPKYGLPPGHGNVYPLKCKPTLLKTYYKRLSGLAIQSYNDENKPVKFEVLEVEKVNISATYCPCYYITFTANDASSSSMSPIIFQACVQVQVPHGVPARGKKPIIMCCRIKSTTVNE